MRRRLSLRTAAAVVHGRRAIMIGTALLTVGLASACSGSEQPAPTPGSTVAPPGTGGAGVPGTSVPLPSNDAVEAAVAADHPDAHGLIEWGLFTREPLGGYRVPVVDGTDRTDAVTVCSAVLDVLVAAGADADIEVLDGATLLASATIAEPTCRAR